MTVYLAVRSPMVTLTFCGAMEQKRLPRVSAGENKGETIDSEHS